MTIAPTLNRFISESPNSSRRRCLRQPERLTHLGCLTVHFGASGVGDSGIELASFIPAFFREGAISSPQSENPASGRLGPVADDRRVAAWLQDTAQAFEEIGKIDLAIDWARQAAAFDGGHQAQRAAGNLADLLTAHRPAELLPERLEAFRRWPNSSTASNLHGAAAGAWFEYAREVSERLASRPRDAVLFALLTLKDLPRAWQLAHELELADTDTWSRLATAYEKVDALAVLPVLEQLARGDLVEADAKWYRTAAVRLDRMRAITAGTDHAAEVDDLIAELRQANRHRPRLQQEFDRAGL